MHVLQAGVAKSGNFWLWKIISELLDAAGVPNDSFVKKQPAYQEVSGRPDLSHSEQASVDVLDVVRGRFYWRLSSLSRQRVTNIESYVDQCTHIWTHSEWATGCVKLLQCVDKTLYIIRDPRDVAVSMANFAFTPYMLKYFPHNEGSVEECLNNRIEWQTRTWVRHVSGWLAHADDRVHVVFYESLRADLQGQLRLLTEFLGVAVSEQHLSRIAHSVSATNMRSANPNHVRRADSGGWREVLTPGQVATVNRVAAPLLRALEYPTDAGASSQPQFKRECRDEYLNIHRKASYGAWDSLRAAYALVASPRPLSDKFRAVGRQLSAIRLR